MVLLSKLQRGLGMCWGIPDLTELFLREEDGWHFHDNLGYSAGTRHNLGRRQKSETGNVQPQPPANFFVDYIRRLQMITPDVLSTVATQMHQQLAASAEVFGWSLKRNPNRGRGKRRRIMEQANANARPASAVSFRCHLRRKITV